MAAMLRRKIHILTLSTLSLMSFAISAFANEPNAQTATVQSIQDDRLGTVSAFQNATRLQIAASFFDLEQKDYMRETY